MLAVGWLLASSSFDHRTSAEPVRKRSTTRT